MFVNDMAQDFQLHDKELEFVSSGKLQLFFS